MSGESCETGQSHPMKFFNRSNSNPKATCAISYMDVDPSFFQKRADSFNEEHRRSDVLLRNADFSYLYTSRPSCPRIDTAASSNSAEDYRSVIDDLTIENKRLREELKRYKQFEPDSMKKGKLFEIKMYGLPRRKRRELEATLRQFAAGLQDLSEAASQPKTSGKQSKNFYFCGQSTSIHCSSSSLSRPVDSGYASLSAGVRSEPLSSVRSLGGATLSFRGTESGEQADGLSKDTPKGLFPQRLVISVKDKMRLVVRRLERLFTGDISGRNFDRDLSMPSMDSRPVWDVVMPFNAETEYTREARFQNSEMPPNDSEPRKKLSPNSNAGNQPDLGCVGEASGGDSGSDGPRRDGGNTSTPTDLPLKQRPTRPYDLDPDRVQLPVETINYIRHLGLVPDEFLLGKKVQKHDFAPDADIGWVYLNLLCNLAQLHMISVTPSFVRQAVTEKSTKLQLSPDGHKIRWCGGSDGTKSSSDSSGNSSQNSPTGEDTDGSNEENRRKKLKATGGEALESALSSKESQIELHHPASSSFHYMPLFAHQSSSFNTSEDMVSRPSSAIDNSDADVSGWIYSGNSCCKKRRRDGAIIYYHEAPFCVDLAGEQCENSSTTYMMSSRQRVNTSSVSLQRVSTGSSLPERPLSDGPATAAETTDIDFQAPELMDSEESALSDCFEYPASETPDVVELKPDKSMLEASGLGGVTPEDHFAVVVTTRRAILGHKKRVCTEHRSNIIANGSATMSPISQAPVPPRSKRDAHFPVKVQYLTGPIVRLIPSLLPPPAMFFPLMSSDSDDSTDCEEDSEGVNPNGSDFAELIPRQGKSHSSNVLYPDEKFCSNEGKHESIDWKPDFEGDDDHRAALRSLSMLRPQTSIWNSGLDTSPPGLLRSGSFAETAGDIENGYTSSMEEDT